MLHRQRTDMRRQLRRILRLLPAQRHRRPQDTLLVHLWQVRTRHDNLGEDHARVRRKRPHLALLAARDGQGDPLGGDDGDHERLGLVVLGEVDGVGDDVRDLFYGERAVASRLQDGGAIVFEDFGVLSRPRAMPRLARVKAKIEQRSWRLEIVPR
jgi:hypothetical protein